MNRFAWLMMLVTLMHPVACAKKIKVGPEAARTIASDAYIYGLPVVENYKVMYAHAVYRDSGAFRAPFNTLAVVTPDTTAADPARRSQYATAWLDLRRGPVVITAPAMSEARRFHVQLIDLYTFHFDELGTDATGNAGGSYLVVQGPWNGGIPDGIVGVLACETSFALAVFRAGETTTDVSGMMERVLMDFNVQTLRAFRGEKEESAPALIFPPYSQESANTAAFFQYLNFALQFCPVHPSEIQVRAEFAKLGIQGGKSFDVAGMPGDILAAVNAGIADAKALLATEAEATPAGAEKYGTRAQLENNYLARAVAAMHQLYGPPKR